MRTTRLGGPRLRPVPTGAILLVLLGALAGGGAAAAPDEEVRTSQIPASLEGFRELEAQLKQVASRAVECTVAIRVGPSQGSGVIVSPDGLILTAGHVIGRPDRQATVILPDGRQVRARTLGLHHLRDSGMLRIEGDEEWPFVELGDADEVRIGDWCVATGHPEGFERRRGPVTRVGRILETSGTFWWTDCPIVSGDSGGPLFDLDGKLIAIHSRIEVPVNSNFHVPIGTFQRSWERLAAGEVMADWRKTDRPMLGIRGGRTRRGGWQIEEVLEGLPAEAAGIRSGDVIHACNGQRIRTIEELILILSDFDVGDEVTVDVKRDEDSFRATVALAPWRQ